MKNITRTTIITLFVILLTLFTPLFRAKAAKGPLFYTIPYKKSVFIILGDTPREVYGFKVLRRGQGEKEFKILTEKEIIPVSDPYTAHSIMGSDFNWIAKKVGTDDPVLLWQRLKANRNLMSLLCLVSHRLRLAAGRTYVDTNNLQPGKQYTYKIIFINSIGKELYSKTKSIKISSPPKQARPSKVRAKAGDGRVSITWEFPRYTGSERDITVGFHIYRSSGGGKLKRITEAPLFRIEKGLYFLDENVQNGKRYTYGVTSVDIIGNIGDIVKSNEVTPVDKTPPIVPMGLTAKDIKEGVLLLWRISPETDFDHYEVIRSNSLRGEYKKINRSPLKSPKYIDKDIVRGKPYFYKVIAVDKNGNKSKPSGAVNIIPKDVTPPGPVKITGITVDKENRYAYIKWSPSPEKDVIGYYIYRGESKEKLIRLNGKPYKPEDPENPIYTDRGSAGKGLWPGKHIFYGISACDSSFNEGKIVIAEVDIPDNVAPHPVFSFSGKITPEGWVVLMWQPSLSRDLSTHRIYRISNKKEGALIIAEINKTKTSYTDKDVIKGKKYGYFITEVDKSGNESKKSEILEFIPTDIHPPASPENLSISSTGRRFTLKWRAPVDDDVAGYNIWYSRNGKKWKKLNRELYKKTEITLKTEEGAYYGVSAVDTSGNEGKKAIVRYNINNRQ